MIPSNQVKIIEQGQNQEINQFSTSFSQSQQYEPQLKMIGKWTPSQHQIFLEHFFILGDNPNKFRIIAQILQGRSSQQVRSHAQKFFQKKFRHDNKIGKRPSDLQLSKDESNVRKTRGQVSGHTKKSKGTKKDRIHQKIIQNIIIRGPSQCFLSETDINLPVANRQSLKQQMLQQ